MTASLLLSLAAGALTVAAPCVLPLLPIIVGGAAVGDGRRSRARPYIIALSLAVSVVVFTLALKATTVLLGVPQGVWQIVSGTIIILLGVDLIFPILWDRISARLRLQERSGEMLESSGSRRGVSGDILTGAALGPVFSSCSPTYALIIAAVLPVSFAEGVVYVVAYAVGLAGMLLLVGLLGRSMVRRLGWLSDPRGWFRRVIGGMFVVVGIAVIVGLDKALQTLILDLGWYAPIEQLEHWIGEG
ncbi:cytochrome c biogenesis CcdA family protein [Microbacterium aurugineum]